MLYMYTHAEQRVDVLCIYTDTDNKNMLLCTAMSTVVHHLVVTIVNGREDRKIIETNEMLRQSAHYVFATLTIPIVCFCCNENLSRKC